MAFDVFISYATKDRVVANAVCARLESGGIRCWIAPRDIVAGTSYGEAIIEAIHAVKVMVLVFSSNANSSGHIPKEVERAVSNGLAILPIRIEDVAPGKSLDYFIGSIHWLDAMTPPLEKHLDNLVETVRKLLPPSEGTQPMPMPMPPPPPPIPPPPAVFPVPAAGTGGGKPKNYLGMGVAATIVIAAAIWGTVQFRPKPMPGPPISVVNPPVSQANPPVNPPEGVIKPGPGKESTPAAESDPIVGCYHWFNNGAVVIHPSGIIDGGPFSGHWRLVNAGLRSYTFTWPLANFSVTISPDQRSLSGDSQYQVPISATRTYGTMGLAGAWNLSNNVPMIAYPNGVLTIGTLNGTWKIVDASRGIYELTWPGPVDSVTLSANGQQISGANQYGIAISGTRTEPCSVR